MRSSPATAIEHGLTVLTANTKHFTPIEGLQVERFELDDQTE